jgi:thiamine biosynthesis lipoprotein
MRISQNKCLKISVLLFSLLCLNGILNSHAQVLKQRQTVLMGSVFHFTLVDKDSAAATRHMEEVIAEISRIENLISEWIPDSQVSLVNQYAGIKPFIVDREVFELTKRAISYSVMTEGAFDISIAALDRVWIFDGTMTVMPSQEEITKSIANVGFQDIVLDSLNSTIYLARKGMKIGFGSIGKGYAADRGRAVMEAAGVKGGIVNASGDLATWGEQLSKKPWVVGVTNPFKHHKILKKIKVRRSAVATSGSYEKFAEIDGKHYAHIINPKTGYPATGLISVTIYGPNTEFANALSTSIMVLGKEKGLKLLKNFLAYKGLLVRDKGKHFSQ